LSFFPIEPFQGT